MANNAQNPGSGLDMDGLRDRIRQALAARGMTIGNLSKATDIPQSTICDFLGGRSVPAFDRVYSICGALDITVDGLGGDLPDTSADGAIQRFEFCAELAWKATQDFLQEQGYLDVHSPLAVMRKAYLEGLVTDEAGWLSLLDARNKTSHLYDDAIADQVYQQIQGSYLALLQGLAERLKA